ncbi:invasion associated locus B family protein [Hansschlegelia sp.]|uniref:invasion associated locus B family protein n=1 Tax=Hansschlegelia sp. TaxID=2041892 RepID=UPI002BE25860|nr:invasion associated locus B family protein [Hansschlegelia sp.]HVI29337.1 invasion associated locus B family protein [Hansschlegelia sp.]
MELGKIARLALLSAAIGVVAVPSYAQDKPAAGDAQKAPDDAAGPGPMPANPPAPPQPNWVKICNTDPNAKKEVCLTSRDLRTETGQTIASVAVRVVSGDNKKFVLAAVPPGLLIQPGVRIAVDQNTPTNGKYSICFPNACYAELEINDAFFNNMKKGNNLVLQAMNQQAKTLNFPVSLSGFTKAYEGPAADPKAIEEYKKEMNEGLNRLAEQQRNKLQAPTTPVPPSDGGPSIGEKAPVKGQ